MGTRIIRKKIKEFSYEEFMPFVAKKVEIVQVNGLTINGILVKLDSENLIVEDHLHHLQWKDHRHSHKIPFVEVAEISMETTSNY